MSTYCKYQKLAQEVSYDNGQTWERTGIYVKGELIEYHSEDCGYEPEYVLKWSDDTTAMTENVASGVSSYTYSLVSTKDGENYPVFFDTLPSWITQASVTPTSMTINVPMNTTTSIRSGQIVIVQNNTTNAIVMNISQAAGAYFVLEFENGTTATTKTVDASTNELQITGVTSWKNFQPISVSRYTSPSWVSSFGCTYPYTESGKTTLNISCDVNTGASRSGDVYIRQNESGKQAVIHLTQPQTDLYEFTLSGGSQSITVPYGADSSAHTFDIVSNYSGNPVMYQSSIGYLSSGSGWISCANTGYGDGGFSVECADNIETSNRSGYVKLLQSGSGEEITLTIVQSGGTWDFLFLWDDSSTQKTVNVSSAASSATFTVNSKYYHYPAAPTNIAPFDVYHVEGLTYSIASDYTSITVSWEANQTSEAIDRAIVLHQKGSNNIISLVIHQSS